MNFAPNCSQIERKKSLLFRLVRLYRLSIVESGEEPQFSLIRERMRARERLKSNAVFMKFS